MTERIKSVCFSSLTKSGGGGKWARDTGKKCPGGGGTPMAPDLTGRRRPAAAVFGQFAGDCELEWPECGDFWSIRFLSIAHPVQFD